MVRRAVLRHVVTAAVLIVPASGAAQTTYGRESRYEEDYGEPIDISLGDLEYQPESYVNRAVRTSGTLELETGERDQFVLRERGFAVEILAMDEVRDHSEGLALGPRAPLGVEGFADILRYSTGR